MVLNYKGIDYKTEWIEYPDLASTFKSFGLPPNDPSGPGFFMPYTAPAIRFEDGKVMMDSWQQAHGNWMILDLLSNDPNATIEIERRYPSPSLHLDDPIVVKVRDELPSITGPLTPEIIPKVSRNLLNKPSYDYYERTRNVRFGMPLRQFEQEKGGEQVWEAVKQPAKEFADLLNKNGGPFFKGETGKNASLKYADKADHLEVTYADFIFVSFLQFLKRVDEVLFKRFLDLDPAFPKIYDASKEWLQKED